jgi:membrane protein DedA with SNARE-associated domain
LGFLQHGLEQIEPYLRTYGALALFVILYFESFGVPLPGESALVASAALAARGDLSIEAVLAAAFFAAVLGDSTGFLIGHVGGQPLLRRVGPRLGLTPERYDKFSALFHRNAFYLVASARFVVVLRQLNGVLSGALGMHWLHFVAANAVGAALWVAVWGLGTYFLGDAIF